MSKFVYSFEKKTGEIAKTLDSKGSNLPNPKEWEPRGSSSTENAATLSKIEKDGYIIIPKMVTGITIGFADPPGLPKKRARRR
jgi:hypothetical protein